MNFDERIDRRNTGALKWDDPYNEAGKEDILPFWVADMDFAAPPAVLEALQERLRHPVFGYTNPPADYPEALSAWYRTRYRADVSPEDFLIGPGVVPSLGIAVRALTSPGSAILVLSPVYYPFFEIVEDNDRRLITAPLSQDPSGRFRLDFRAMGESVAKAAEAGIKTQALLFCSPHNPGGRLWTPDELAELQEFCRQRGLALISDEIHADILPDGGTFTSLAGADSSGGPHILAIGAPNKTFNLAGLHLSHLVAHEGETRRAIERGMAAAGYSQPNIFSIVAARAAYLRGGPWLDELNAYLGANLDYAEAFMRDRIPGIVFTRPEAGYLAWLEASEAIRRKGCADDRQYAAALAREGRIRISFGSKFGAEGKNHLRLNVACPRAQLAQGLERWARWASPV
jgi:cystathionine beta-lyase